MALRRYWFEFTPTSKHRVGDLICTMPWACGVTAYGLTDALGQVERQWPAWSDDHQLTRQIEDVDVSQVAAEAAQRMTPIDFGVPVVRGIWYPHLSNP